MQGFQQQVKRWPQQPLQRAVAWVAALPAHFRVADFGCGDAQLARSVPHAVTSLDLVAANERVTACNMAHTPLGVPPLLCGWVSMWRRGRPFSLLLAGAGIVKLSVPCLTLIAGLFFNISQPLSLSISVACAASGSQDAAVFCLSLMGTDYAAFLEEAHRVLTASGRLWIAEVLAYQ